MKNTTLVILALTATVFAGCDEQKTAIDKNKEVTKEAIDSHKDAVDAAAVAAKKQTDIDAAIDKAKIEAKKDATQAQLMLTRSKPTPKPPFKKPRLTLRRSN